MKVLKIYYLIFLNDTKLVDTVSSDLEMELHLDLKQLYDWSIDWQKLFNVNKCTVLHFGYINVYSIYSLGAEVSLFVNMILPAYCNSVPLEPSWYKISAILFTLGHLMSSFSK